MGSLDPATSILAQNSHVVQQYWCRPIPRLETFGPPPTIEHLRGHGLKAFYIYCRALPCRHVGWMTFDELALPDEMIFIHIARHRRLVCSGCGRAQFEISLDWRDHRAKGKGPQ